MARLAVVAGLLVAALATCDPPPPPPAICPPATATSRGWRFEVLDGDVTCGVGRRPGNIAGSGPNVEALVVDGALHVFYFDGSPANDLRHAWWTGTGWRYETVDGDGTGTTDMTAKTSYSTGEGIAAVVWDGRVSVFYNVANSARLKLARWTGSAWSYEQVSASTSRELDVVVYGGVPHVFHGEGASGGSDLHHTWWSGSTWWHEDLDGHVAGANGSVARAADVGVGIRALLSGGQLHLFYGDDFAATARDLRQGWYTPGSGWRFQTLDGNGPGHSTTGRTDHRLGTAAVLQFGTGPHLFYADENAEDVRHAWWSGSGWRYEVLDGDAPGPGGRVAGRMSSAWAVTEYRGEIHLFVTEFAGSGNAVDFWTRHLWWTGTTWLRETLDDPAAPRYPDPPTGGVRGPGTALVYGPQLQTFALRVYGTYTGGSTGNITDGDLRHAWYG